MNDNREEQLINDLLKPTYVLRMALPAARNGATPQMRKSGRTRAINARKQIHDIAIAYAVDYGYFSDEQHFHGVE